MVVAVLLPPSLEPQLEELVAEELEAKVLHVVSA
jgi:hypothetical protein